MSAGSRMSGNIEATRGAATGRPLDILLWCVQAVLALVFVSASWAKLMGTPEMVALFTAVGSGQWFRYVTGILELTGAVLIMVPKTRRIGAALLATIMLGALTDTSSSCTFHPLHRGSGSSCPASSCGDGGDLPRALMNTEYGPCAVWGGADPMRSGRRATR